MEYLHSIFDEIINEPTAISVGKFDGIHKGHNLLTERIVSKKSEGLKSCIVTFSVSPRFKLGSDMTPCLITNRERELVLEKLGIDYLVECPFDEKLMNTSADDFIAYLVKNLNMKYMAVGSDFTFGYKGLGNTALLSELAAKYNFELDVIDKIRKEDRDISSTFIREELEKGNIALVNEMLGYEYFVWGNVVHGAHLGHKIGIPTINIIPPMDKLVPKYGVYITKIELEGRTYHGVTNVGCKPTVNNENIVGIETNIFDFNANIYEHEVKVTFLEFIRPEMKFQSVDELKTQMERDKKTARDYFNAI